MSELEYEPDPPECVGLDNLVEALTTGKVPRVVQALRALASLDPSVSKSAVTLVADVLEDDPALRGIFPRRLTLKFVSRGRGRPPRDRWRQSANQFAIAHAVESELVHAKKVDSVVEEVAKRLKRGKSTVYEALSKAKKNKNHYSK